MPLNKAEALVATEGLSRDAFCRAAETTAGEVDAQTDIHAPAEYRRALIEVLLDRALCRAAAIEDSR